MKSEDKNISEEEEKKKKHDNEVCVFLIVVCCVLLGGGLLFSFANGDFDKYIEDKYDKYENVDNLVGLCGMKIGDTKETVDAYLFKKMNTKAKLYEETDVYLSDRYDYFIKNKINIETDDIRYERRKMTQKDVDFLKSHYINNGKFIEIRPNGWQTTKGLNLVVYVVHGLNIKDLMLEDLRLVFYNNELIHIDVTQNELGRKLFRAKYGEHEKIKNGDIVARSSDYNELKIYDKVLVKDYEKELKEKSKANQKIEAQQLLKEYSEY